MHELSHMVESGVNLTELDAMTGCTTPYPNYPGSAGTKGLARRWQDLRGTAPLS